MTRKHRADSASESVRVMVAATKRIDPPSNVPLDSGDLPFFASVIAEFARADWTAHQLELAIAGQDDTDFSMVQNGLQLQKQGL